MSGPTDWHGHWALRVLLLAVALTGCDRSSGGNTDTLDQLFTGELEVIDLTHALSATMAYWPSPDGNPFKHDTIRAHADGSPSMAAYFTPEHHGTHLDAPVHSAEGQLSVDRLTSTDLFGPAAVIDISTQSQADMDYRVTLADVEAWEAEHGPIPSGAIVLLYTGWADKYTDPVAYANLDDQGRLRFPGFSVEVAELLVNERDIRGIGIDNLSIDYGLSRDYAVHGIVNGAGKFQLENVANLGRVPAVGAYLIVAPIKIEGGSGGQVRIFAVLPSSS
jgi:kynurenine formamidase